MKSEQAGLPRSWSRHPLIYEINTWVWLKELGQASGREMTLADVPGEDWDAVAALGPDAVWLMGVWERSPAGIAVSMQNAALLVDFQRALPDFCAADNVGSPYCVRRYAVAEQIGGQKGLASARRELFRRGIRLILDYVPNHVAPDHPWSRQHPEYFIPGTAADLTNRPAEFLKVEDHIFACGKDPFFPAWPDVLQLNAFHPGLRRAALETVTDIAAQCDGIRCDMAMLCLNSIFAQTWGERSGVRPESEYWPDLIEPVKQRFPDFRFIAEAYWDLEWELQQQGFDYCYDKRLYDRLEHDSAESVRMHLLADLAYQDKLTRFIENHDEPRAAAAFPPEKLRAAAVVTTTLPGARLIHEGQIDGRKVRLPVFLGRRPAEPSNNLLRSFYHKLLQAIRSEAIREGVWQLCECVGWPDNQTCRHLLAWCWHWEEQRCLVVVNFSPQRAQALISLPWTGLARRNWDLRDMLSGECFQRGGDMMGQPGLYVDLAGWAFHFLDFTTS